MAKCHGAKIARIDHGEAIGEQFAINHPLAKAGDDAKANALGQLIKRIRHTAHVARLDMLQTVAQNHPVDGRSIRLGAGFARIPDKLCIKAWARHLIAYRVDLTDKIEIDKTVVHRRNQRICPLGGHARKPVVPAWRVDDEKISIGGKFVKLLGKMFKALAIMRQMARHGQRPVNPRDSRCAVVEIAPKRALAVIKVKRGHPRAARCKRDGDMNRRRRFPGSAFFISKHNNMWLTDRYISQTVGQPVRFPS